MDNLKSSQVRYYYQPQDTEKAQEIAAMLARDVGIGDVEIKVFPEYQGKVRQNQFEVWLK
ncbi:MAG TPA: hypothetical protein VMT02_03485 [Burkholderiales bacterium]|nr:hypothetical protein [Burkholderiales bacterium]